MEELSKLKEKRKQYNEHISAIQFTGANWEDKDWEINQKLMDIHSRILEIELKDPNTLKERTGYSVCGWSENHNFFRNKYFVSEDLKEAKAEFEKLKNDPTWGIPTIIVQETKFRSESFSSSDFDNDAFENLGSADSQYLICKHMCGNKELRWKDLLHGNYTY